MCLSASPGPLPQARGAGEQGLQQCATKPKRSALLPQPSCPKTAALAVAVPFTSWGSGDGAAAVPGRPSGSWGHSSWLSASQSPLEQVKVSMF